MRLGLGWADAAAVVVAAVGMYAALVILVRVAGQRILTGLSSVDYAAAGAVGAVVGRAILGFTPTLLGGVLGLTTLFGVHWSVVRVRCRHVHRVVDNRPILLVVDGVVLPDQLRRAGIGADDLRQRLRQAGIGRYADVAAVVLERTGAVSVLPRGVRLAREVFADVHGGEQLHHLAAFTDPESRA